MPAGDVRELMVLTPAASTAGASADGEVATNSTAKVEHNFQQDGVITRVQGRAYYGQEKNVEYRLELIKEGANVINLIGETHGDGESVGYLAGNGENYNFRTHHPFESGDVLRASYTNNDGANNQPVQLMVVIDYANKVEELIERAFGGDF